ncbi:MAG: beta-lactamase class [Acidobacteriota bacterium]|jgi:beta-lactamase class A|nr:beta-lactamase class [Acidobacteriota bacterium]
MLSLILAAAFTLPPQQSDAVIGVTAIHLESGRRVSVRGTERFPMGSVYKFPIALTVLKRVDSGTLSLDREVTIQPREFAPGWSPLRDEARKRPITLTVRELLRHIFSISDNTASDALMKLVGGPFSVTTRMAELGFGGIRVDRSEAQMAHDLDAEGGVERYAIDARDTASPDSMAELLLAFWQRRDGLTKESHDLLVEWMTDTPTGPRRIKAAMPANAVVTHKTGTMPGTANDAAIVTAGGQHVALVVFTKKGTSKLELIEDDLAAVARAAFDAVLSAP